MRYCHRGFSLSSNCTQRPATRLARPTRWRSGLRGYGCTLFVRMMAAERRAGRPRANPPASRPGIRMQPVTSFAGSMALLIFVVERFWARQTATNAMQGRIAIEHRDA